MYYMSFLLFTFQPVSLAPASWSAVHQKYTQVGSKSITISGTLPRNEYMYLADHEIIDVQDGDILGKGEISILISEKS